MATSTNEPQNQCLQTLVAHVAAAYFSKSHVPPADIPQVIAQIRGSLIQIGPKPALAESPAPTLVRTTPAQVRKSITPDALISFEDGRSYKTLRRHLSVRGLAPQQYSEKWGLPLDYPMVSPNYSAARSQMARALGLGQKGPKRRRKQAAAKPVAAK